MRPRRHPRHGLLRFGIGLLEGVGRGQQNPRSERYSRLNLVESVLDIQHIWDIWDIRDDIWDIRDDRSSFIPYIIIYPRIFVYV